MSDVLTIGAPLLDYVIPISESFLSTIPGEKGGMEIIDLETMKQLLLYAGDPAKEAIGGSAANVAKTLARLGTQTSFVGKVGHDAAGKRFVKALEKVGVKSYCTESTLPTGHVMCLITEDSLRTCRSYLGASQEITPHDLKAEYFKDIKHLHLEGYTFLRDKLTEKAMDLAKTAGAQISLDLGSFEVVQEHRDRILSLIKNYVNILFANEQEATALTDLEADLSCAFLKEFCDIAIVFLGENGCLLGSQNQKPQLIPAFKVKAVDTTGAGDCFAAGFIHAYLQNKSLESCAKLGAFAAAEVVQIFGTDLPYQSWKQIQAFEKTLLP